MATFTDRRVLEVIQIRGLATPLTTRYRMQLPELRAGHSVIEIRLELKTPVDEIWLAAPRETDSQFLRFATRVSAAIQETLRTWLPYLWFSNPERFRKFDTVATLLTYSACRPYTAKNKQAYTFDILDDDTPRAILYSVKRAIRKKLLPVAQMLRALNHPCARQYTQLHIDRIIAVYQRNHHRLNSILVAERDLVEEFIARPKTMLDPTQMEKSSDLINRRLKKLFAYNDFRFLRNLLEIEATRAAAIALRIDPGFSSTISANSPLLLPLNRHEEDSLPRDGMEPAELRRAG